LALFPTRTLPKGTLVGDALSTKVAAAVAVPERVTVGAVFEALLLIVNEPENVPAALGANLTVIVVDWLAGTEIGNPVVTRLNPVPETVALVTDIAVPPVFETCKDTFEDVPATMLPKLRLVVERLIWAGAAVTVTVAEADLELSAILVAFTV
jgi:hypothetical protein